MSDTGRKDMTSKIAETLTPQEQKSTGQKAKEGITNVGDKAGSGAQPESEKSITQKATDTVTGGGSSKPKEGESMLDSAKDAMGMKK